MFLRHRGLEKKLKVIRLRRVEGKTFVVYKTKKIIESVRLKLKSKVFSKVVAKHLKKHRLIEFEKQTVRRIDGESDNYFLKCTSFERDTRHIP